MNSYNILLQKMPSQREVWLVTGAAGFIGSNLVETLLKAGQEVRGLDNFFSGHRVNLELVEEAVGAELWKNFYFIEGDIRVPEDCAKACAGVDYVLHQAALGSVPRSIEDPALTNACNIDGFLNMLVAAKNAGVKNFVYAASSSTYGDEPSLPKLEDRIGNPLSPYAVTKLVDELYAKVFATTYGFECIGLRYFNIFGERQDPEGAYAAVIPKWFKGAMQGETIYINGDGETSRDFCYIDNCVQANLLAAKTENPEARNQVYNVAVGERTTLNRLLELIKSEAARHSHNAADVKAEYRDFRAGDVRHSLADIGKARKLLGYEPEFTLEQGLARCSAWYAEHL